MRAIDITGQRYGKLVAVRKVASANGALWLCDCDCGKSREVICGELRRGGVRACIECCKLNKKPPPFKKSHSRLDQYRRTKGLYTYTDCDASVDTGEGW